uniref:Uncharacterized protein n=1 Tax=Sphaerodactylus townsendi TaxID=933632 RepID=A0ACB8ECZ4_9SAUR
MNDAAGASELREEPLMQWRCPRVANNKLVASSGNFYDDIKSKVRESGYQGLQLRISDAIGSHSSGGEAFSVVASAVPVAPELPRGGAMIQW